AHAPAAGGEGVQIHAQRAVEAPAALLGRAVLARVAGGGVTGAGVGGAGHAGVRSRGAGAAAALRAGRGLVAGQVDAGDERDVHARGSGRGIAAPARVARDDVDDAGREGGDRRVLDRQRRPEETLLDGLARAAGAAAIRVRCAARLRGIRVDAVARRRARPLGAIAIAAGPVAGDERVAGADVEEGGGSGRGGARRDPVGTAAADVQTRCTEVIDQRRAAGVGVDRARERRGRGGRETRPAAARRAGRGGEREAVRRGWSRARARLRLTRDRDPLDVRSGLRLDRAGPRPRAVLLGLHRYARERSAWR